MSKGGMLNCVIFDVDGTLANNNGRQKWLASKPRNWKAYFAEMHNDLPIEPVIRILKELSRNYYVMIVTARPALYEQQTVEWLAKHEIKYDKLYMREKNDFRDDSIVKEEILDKILEEGFAPFVVFDDRKRVVDMWVERGIFVCDVSQGNGNF